MPFGRLAAPLRGRDAPRPVEALAAYPGSRMDVHHLSPGAVADLLLDAPRAVQHDRAWRWLRHPESLARALRSAEPDPGQRGVLLVELLRRMPHDRAGWAAAGAVPDSADASLELLLTAAALDRDVASSFGAAFREALPPGGLRDAAWIAEDDLVPVLQALSRTSSLPGGGIVVAAAAAELSPAAQGQLRQGALPGPGPFAYPVPSSCVTDAQRSALLQEIAAFPADHYDAEEELAAFRRLCARFQDVPGVEAAYVRGIAARVPQSPRAADHLEFLCGYLVEAGGVPDDLRPALEAAVAEVVHATTNDPLHAQGTPRPWAYWVEQLGLSVDVGNLPERALGASAEELRGTTIGRWLANGLRVEVEPGAASVLVEDVAAFGRALGEQAVGGAAAGRKLGELPLVEEELVEALDGIQALASGVEPEGEPRWDVGEVAVRASWDGEHQAVRVTIVPQDRRSDRPRSSPATEIVAAGGGSDLRYEELPTVVLLDAKDQRSERSVPLESAVEGAMRVVGAWLAYAPHLASKLEDGAIRLAPAKRPGTAVMTVPFSQARLVLSIEGGIEELAFGAVDGTLMAQPVALPMRVRVKVDKVRAGLTPDRMTRHALEVLGAERAPGPAERLPLARAMEGFRQSMGAAPGRTARRRSTTRSPHGAATRSTGAGGAMDGGQQRPRARPDAVPRRPAEPPSAGGDGSLRL